MRGFSRPHSAHPGRRFFTRLDRCCESQIIVKWSFVFDCCFGSGAKQNQTNLQWGSCDQRGKKSPIILRPQANPERPLGGDSVREGQVWAVVLKAVRLPTHGSLWKKENEEAQLKWRETLAASVYVRSLLLFGIWKKEKKKGVNAAFPPLHPHASKGGGTLWAKSQEVQWNTPDWLWQETKWEPGDLLSPKQDSFYSQGKSQRKTLSTDTRTDRQGLFKLSL